MEGNGQIVDGDKPKRLEPLQIGALLPGAMNGMRAAAQKLSREASLSRSTK